MPDERMNKEDPQSFVVRMWREGLGRWRGKISHVQSQESRAFIRLDESTSFMAERLPGIETTKKQETITEQAPNFKFQVPIKGWLPLSRSRRLAMAAVSVCVVAAVTVLFYPTDSSNAGLLGNLAATAQGSGLGTALIFFLGAVAGGAAVGVWARLKSKGGY